MKVLRKLVFFKLQVSSAQGTFKIHSIELPRIGLSFTSVTDGHDTKLCSDQFAGLFVSNKRSPTVLVLMEGIPHSILLEDSHEELFMLVPATVLPLRPDTETDRTIHFPSTVLLNRCAAVPQLQLGPPPACACWPEPASLTAGVPDRAGTTRPGAAGSAPPGTTSTGCTSARRS